MRLNTNLVNTNNIYALANAMVVNSKVVSLDLFDNDLGFSISALAPVLRKNRVLKTLNLQKTQLTDSGMLFFSQK